MSEERFFFIFFKVFRQFLLQSFLKFVRKFSILYFTKPNDQPTEIPERITERSCDGAPAAGTDNIVKRPRIEALLRSDLTTRRIGNWETGRAPRFLLEIAACSRDGPSFVEE